MSADPNNPNGFRQSTRGKDGQPIGAKADADWHYITPNALAGVLTYIGERYSQPETWVTEFGTSVPGEAHWPANQVGCSVTARQQLCCATVSMVFGLSAVRPRMQVLNDTFRTSMYHGYLGKACAAIKQRNLNVPKVFAWTSFDKYAACSGVGHLCLPACLSVWHARADPLTRSPAASCAALAAAVRTSFEWVEGYEVRIEGLSRRQQMLCQPCARAVRRHAVRLCAATCSPHLPAACRSSTA